MKQEIGDFLLEQILLDVGSQKSPVSGERFPALSKEYKAEKIEEGGPGVPDLELTGSMLGDLDFKVTGDGLKIGIFGSNAPKADGHNNISGKSDLPLRQFIPNEGEGFRATIEKGIESIIADSLAEELEVPEDELDEVETKKELFDLLEGIFDGLSRPEIIGAVTLNDAWREALKARGLLKLL